MVKIYIDAGHGGAEPGATYNGYIEKDLNLKYAKKIFDILAAYNCQLFMTRHDDSTVSVDKRAGWIRTFEPDVCIACHFNAGGGSGAEAILSVSAPAYITTLATMIVKNICNTFALTFRGAYTREASYSKPTQKIDYYGLHRLGSTNVIIVEPLFLDNKGDIQLLKNEKFMDNLAFCIASTVIGQLKLTKKVEPIPAPPPKGICPAEKSIIQQHCNFSRPEYWWGVIDKDKNAEAFYRKWAGSYK